MRNIYKENIKNLMLNILQKNEKEVIKIKAMPKELKMQVATDINELLMSYIALEDKKGIKKIDLKEVIDFTNSIIPEMKLHFDEDVYFYNRLNFAYKEFEEQVNKHNELIVRNIPFEIFINTSKNIENIYLKIKEYKDISFDELTDKEKNYIYVRYYNENPLREIGMFLFDMNEIRVSVLNDENTKVSLRTIIDRYYKQNNEIPGLKPSSLAFDRYYKQNNEDEEFTNKEFTSYFDEKKFLKKYKKTTSSEKKEAITNYFKEQKSLLWDLLKIRSDNDILFFNWILSFKNNQLERDIEYTFKKTPDKYNIFENIGKEIVHLFNCEKVKKEYENLSSEIKKEIKSDIVETIKIKGKI
mgnify:FL=1